MGQLRPREGDLEFTSQQPCRMRGWLLLGGLKKLWPSLALFNHPLFTLRRQMNVWQPDAAWLQMGGRGGGVGKLVGWSLMSIPSPAAKCQNIPPTFLPW